VARGLFALPMRLLAPASSALHCRFEQGLRCGIRATATLRFSASHKWRFTHKHHESLEGYGDSLGGTVKVNQKWSQ
jgi:hypothetical protein